MGRTSSSLVGKRCRWDSYLRAARVSSPSSDPGTRLASAASLSFCKSMEINDVTAWNNGAHHASGAGYGLKVKAADGDAYFRRHWRTATIELPNGVCPGVNIDKDSFWSPSCRELIS
jgi:hypothetical protein